MITEKHVCIECKHKIGVPLDKDFISWELGCQLKSKDVNPAGGLTNCKLFEEE